MLPTFSASICAVKDNHSYILDSSLRNYHGPNSNFAILSSNPSIRCTIRS